MNTEQGTLQRQERGREGEVEGEDRGRYGLSHCVDVWCENSICSSPVIVTQFPLSYTCVHTHLCTSLARINSHLTNE